MIQVISREQASRTGHADRIDDDAVVTPAEAQREANDESPWWPLSERAAILEPARNQ
jgi:hypothetical protein